MTNLPLKSVRLFIKNRVSLYFNKSQGPPKVLLCKIKFQWRHFSGSGRRGARRRVASTAWVRRWPNCRTGTGGMMVIRKLLSHARRWKAAKDVSIWKKAQGSKSFIESELDLRLPWRKKAYDAVHEKHANEIRFFQAQYLLSQLKKKKKKM